MIRNYQMGGYHWRHMTCKNKNRHDFLETLDDIFNEAQHTPVPFKDLYLQILQICSRTFLFFSRISMDFPQFPECFFLKHELHEKYEMTSSPNSR